MDPISPIVTASAPIRSAARGPVQPLKRVSRERDRPDADGGQKQEGREREEERPPGERGEGLHVDVRA